MAGVRVLDQFGKPDREFDALAQLLVLGRR